MTDSKPIDPDLLALFICPVTHSPLSLSDDGQSLISQTGNLRYPIREGIPVLLPDEAILPDGPDGFQSLDAFKARFL